MSLDFDDSDHLPGMQVAVSVLSGMVCICAFAATGTIFATIWLRTDSTKRKFMQLLEDHVLLNHRHSIAEHSQNQDDTIESAGGSTRWETISAPLPPQNLEVLPIHNPAAISTIPTQGNVDDLILDMGEEQPDVQVQSSELSLGEVLSAAHLEQSFLQVVRAVGTMESLLGTILSCFTTFLSAGWVVATYVCTYNIMLDGLHAGSLCCAFSPSCPLAVGLCMTGRLRRQHNMEATNFPDQSIQSGRTAPPNATSDSTGVLCCGGCTCKLTRQIQEGNL